MTNRNLISLVVLTSVSALGALKVLMAQQPVGAAEEQAVIATIKLRSGGMGSTEERNRIFALEDQLSEAIKKSSAGEFDGDEWGDGVCTIYMYGRSAERLFEVTLPILRKFGAPQGSYVVKRYGKPGAKQDRAELSGP